MDGKQAAQQLREATQQPRAAGAANDESLVLASSAVQESSRAAVVAFDNDIDGSNNGISSNQRAPKTATNAFLTPDELIFYAKYLLRKDGLIEANLPPFSKTIRGRMDDCTIHRKADLVEYIPLQVFTALVDEANRQLIEDPTEQASSATLTEFVIKRNPTSIKSHFLMGEGPFEAFVELEFTTQERQAVWFTTQGRQAVCGALKKPSTDPKKIIIGGVVNAFIPHATAIVSATKTHVHDALKKMVLKNTDDVATELWSDPEQNAPTAGAASENELLASSTSGQEQHGIDGADERNSTTANDATLRAELERLQGELSAVTQRFEASQDESALQQQVRELQAELERAHQENASQAETISSLTVEQDESALQQQVRELQAELERAHQENASQAETISSLTVEQDESALQQQVREMQAELERAHQENASQAETLSSLTVELNRSEAEVGSVYANWRATLDTVLRLQQQASLDEAETESYRQRLGALENMIYQLTEILIRGEGEDYRGRFRALEAMIHQLNRLLGGAEDYFSD